MSMMQSSGGLLGAFSGEEQAAPAQAGGGLLNAVAGGQGGQGSQGGLQMAQSLLQNPTPEMAQQVIQALSQKGSPEAQQMVQILSQIADNPDALKQFASQIISQIGGG